MAQLRQQSKRSEIRKSNSPTYAPASHHSQIGQTGQNGQHEEADAVEKTTGMEDEDVPIPSAARPPIHDDLVSPAIAECVFSPQGRSVKSVCDTNSPSLFGLWGFV